VFQPMLLLVEVILVLAAGYICWMTRRQMVDMRAQMALAAGGSDQSPAGRAGQLEMMNDLADVLADVRSNVQDMRAEWQGEKEALRHQLEQAEKTVAEMRAQVVQARMQPGTCALPTHIPGAVATGLATHTAACDLTLDDGLGLFVSHLRASGLSESSIKGIAGPVHQFALWLGGQRHAHVELRAVDPSEVERFVGHLYRRHQNLTTIRRKASAVRRFLTWSRESEFEPTVAQTPAQKQPAVVPVTVRPEETCPVDSQPECYPPKFRPPVTTYSPFPAASAVAERRQTVLSLAHQGVDAATIAARVGIDRETVRMLLATRDNGHAGHINSDRLAIPVGAVFPHPATHVMHQAPS
jgi:hypothetical protein